jgi:hypothetical protein
MSSRLLRFLSEEANIIMEFLSNPDIGPYEFRDKMAKALRKYVYETLTSFTGGKSLIELPKTPILGESTYCCKKFLRG